MELWKGPKEKRPPFFGKWAYNRTYRGYIYIYNSIYNWWPTTSKNQQGPLPKREVKEPVVLQWCVDFLRGPRFEGPDSLGSKIFVQDN